jgi:hypothetical protein
MASPSGGGGAIPTSRSWCTSRKRGSLGSAGGATEPCRSERSRASDRSQARESKQGCERRGRKPTCRRMRRSRATGSRRRGTATARGPYFGQNEALLPGSADDDRPRSPARITGSFGAGCHTSNALTTSQNARLRCHSCDQPPTDRTRLPGGCSQDCQRLRRRELPIPTNKNAEEDCTTRASRRTLRLSASFRASEQRAPDRRPVRGSAGPRSAGGGSALTHWTRA